MSFMRVVKVTIVQIVDVAAVTYRGVAAARPMLMSMVGMGTFVRQLVNGGP